MITVTNTNGSLFTGKKYGGRQGADAYSRGVGLDVVSDVNATIPVSVRNCAGAKILKTVDAYPFFQDLAAGTNFVSLPEIPAFAVPVGWSGAEWDISVGVRRLAKFAGKGGEGLMVSSPVTFTLDTSLATQQSMGVGLYSLVFGTTSYTYPTLAGEDVYGVELLFNMKDTGSSDSVWVAINGDFRNTESVVISTSLSGFVVSDVFSKIYSTLPPNIISSHKDLVSAATLVLSAGVSERLLVAAEPSGGGATNNFLNTAQIQIDDQLFGLAGFAMGGVKSQDAPYVSKRLSVDTLTCDLQAVALDTANNLLYIIAGRQSAITAKLCYVVDLTLNTVASIKNYPKKRHSVAAAFGGDGELYCFCGYQGTVNKNKVHRYKTNNNTWQNKQNFPIETRALLAQTLPDGNILLFGGYPLNQNLYRYNILTDDYTTYNSVIPEQLTYGDCAIFNGVIWIASYPGICKLEYNAGLDTYTYTKIFSIDLWHSAIIRRNSTEFFVFVNAHSASVSQLILLVDTVAETVTDITSTVAGTNAYFSGTPAYFTHAGHTSAPEGETGGFLVGGDMPCDLRKFSCDPLFGNQVSSGAARYKWENTVIDENSATLVSELLLDEPAIIATPAKLFAGASSLYPDFSVYVDNAALSPDVPLTYAVPGHVGLRHTSELFAVYRAKTIKIYALVGHPYVADMDFKKLPASKISAVSKDWRSVTFNRHNSSTGDIEDTSNMSISIPALELYEFAFVSADLIYSRHSFPDSTKDAIEITISEE